MLRCMDEWEPTLLSKGVPECGYSEAPPRRRAPIYDICGAEPTYLVLSRYSKARFFVCLEHAPVARSMEWLASMRSL